MSVNSSLNVSWNSPVKPSGPALLFVGSFVITVSISMLVIGLSYFLFLPVQFWEPVPF